MSLTLRTENGRGNDSFDMVNVRRNLRRLAKNQVGPRLLPRLPRRVDFPHETFGLSVASSGRLQLREHDLVALTEEYGSPLHVVDAVQLDAAVDEAIAPFAASAGSGCDVFYSYKTNPVPAVLNRLHVRGIGAEVISAYELWLALRLGVPGDRIIFNGPVKSTESIRRAIDEGVLAINANSHSEAMRIRAIAHDAGQTVRLGIRVALQGAWGGQFGMAAKLDDLVALVDDAREDPLVDLVSLHVHRGGTLRGSAAVEAHVNQVLEFLDVLVDRTGWCPEIVDFGGSLASPTVGPFENRQYRLNRLLGADLLPPDPDRAMSIGAASTLAARLLADWAGRTGVPTPRGVIEPGRSLTSQSQFLLTTVVDVKADVEPSHAIVDAGINVADAAAHEYHQLYSVTQPTAVADTPYRIAGPICTPADVLYNNWRLPELDAGDILAIMDAGAYFVPFSTSFSFPRPAIVVCEPDGAVRVGRKAEHFEDLVRLDVDSASL